MILNLIAMAVSVVSLGVSVYEAFRLRRQMRELQYDNILDHGPYRSLDR